MFWTLEYIVKHYGFQTFESNVRGIIGMFWTFETHFWASSTNLAPSNRNVRASRSEICY